ncbi:MAG: hypothetical protein B7Z62_08610 [Deltaproteobacteria bacterium 37-65-8]|nr:MAG: hypothetical protein B7Z62_08610 [Deltaproteobacteria bacterium 37-65-8]
MATTHNTAAESAYFQFNEVLKLADQISSVAAAGMALSEEGEHECNLFAVIERLALEDSSLGSLKLAIDKLAQTSGRHV